MPPKLGRNDPCWCGSGKKYKRCHWREDKEEKRAALTVQSPVVSASDLLDDLGDNEPDEWAQFERAPLDDQIAMFQAKLEDKSLDDELAFEMLLTIRDTADPQHSAQARAQFSELVDDLRRTMPGLYAQSLGFYLRNLIKDKVADRHWDDLPPLLNELAENAPQNLEQFSEIIELLMYHGQIRPLLAAMDTAWPEISDATELFGGAIDEFSETLLKLVLFDYLGSTSSPHVDDPLLVQKLSRYGEFDRKWFELALHHLTTPTPWQHRDFDKLIDADQWHDHMNKLLFEFVGDQYRRNHIPLSRGEMLRTKLGAALHQHFVTAPLDEAASNRRSRKRRPTQRRPASTYSDTLLIPAPGVLSQAFTQEFGMFGAQPYQAGILYELLPAYLHFLGRLGLISVDEMDRALRQLKSSAIQAAQSLEQYGAQLLLVENIRAAWDDDTLDALRQSPELAAAPAVDETDLIIDSPPPQTMRFKITYLYEPDAWFVIKMRGDQSLDDLHWAILDAVDFDADHLYAFFISGKAWDKSTEYSNNKDARGQSNIRLQKLPLRLKQHFLYLYDFGSEHRFQVQLIDTGHDQPTGTYPRMIEQHGEMPPQYG